MATSTQSSFIAFITLIFLQFCPGSYSATLNFTNKCNYAVWPGILSRAGTLLLSTTGFALQPGESKVVAVSPVWSGSLWGRTLCSLDFAGRFSCVTGDCGSSTVDCAGRKPAAPVTLAEFILDGAGGRDFFDVSFVKGYNVPMIVEPRDGSGDGNCKVTGCRVDLNTQCPMDLTVKSRGRNVACKSACEAFGDLKYCCSGFYATPVTCKPSWYSQFYKSVCPHAYSYVYDNASTIFSCASTDYTIIFCPASSSSLFGAGNKYPVAEDNMGRHVDDGSYRNITAVAIVIIICGLTACTWTIKIRFLNRNCDIHMVAGTRADGTITLDPQRVSTVAVPLNSV